MSQHAAAMSKGPAAALRDLVVIAALIVPGVTWLLSVQPPADYLVTTVPPGQFLYVLAKLAGLYAIVFLWLQVLYGLLRGASWGGLTPDWTVPAHRNLGLIVVGLVVLHAGLFITAVSLRGGHFAYNLLFPNFNGVYYPSIVSLGVTAAWLLVAVLIAASLRNRSGTRWVWAHRLGLLAIVLVCAHSLLVGSESRVGGMPYLYGVMVGSFVAALIYRYLFHGARGSALATAREA